MFRVWSLKGVWTIVSVQGNLMLLLCLKHLDIQRDKMDVWFITRRLRVLSTAKELLGTWQKAADLRFPTSATLGIDSSTSAFYDLLSRTDAINMQDVAQRWPWCWVPQVKMLLWTLTPADCVISSHTQRRTSFCPDMKWQWPPVTKSDCREIIMGCFPLALHFRQFLDILWSPLLQLHSSCGAFRCISGVFNSHF